MRSTILRGVRTLTRRIAAIGALLALSVGNLAVCGGWQPAPEARMACCTDDEACPMHGSESHHADSKRDVSRAQADSCCAASPGNHSTTTNSAFVLIAALAPATVPAPLAVPSTRAPFDTWRALLPLPASPVPKHLLLSVLLV